MYEVQVLTTTPGGVESNVSRSYYEVNDALLVAKIEKNNALLPIGRIEEPDPHRLSYKVVGNYGDDCTDSVLVTVRNEKGDAVTLF